MSIFDSDTIFVKGKRQACEHIISGYGDFGWSLTDRKDDKLYEDIVHLTFTRPHFIKNRDRLQLLQVRLEIAYNRMGKFSYKIPVRASLLGTFLVLLALSLVAGGVLLFLLLGGLISQIAGGVLLVSGVLAFVFSIIFPRRLLKRDKEKYSRLIDGEIKNIKGICLSARQLRGEDE